MGDATKTTKDLGRFARFRDTSQVAQSSGAYSRRVFFLKRVLPLFAVGLLAALVIWPFWKGPKIADMVAANVPGLIIENLHYTGTDSADQPYSLSAKRATQVDNRKSLVDLEGPEAEITLKSGAWVSGRAQKGRYDQDQKKLDLSGQVELFHDEGTQILTDELSVDLNAHTATGGRPVKILGGFGQIEGVGFQVLEKGKTIIIQGPAKALLKEKQLSLQPEPKFDK